MLSSRFLRNARLYGLPVLVVISVVSFLFYASLSLTNIPGKSDAGSSNVEMPLGSRVKRTKDLDLPDRKSFMKNINQSIQNIDVAISRKTKNSSSNHITITEDDVEITQPILKKSKVDNKSNIKSGNIWLNYAAHIFYYPWYKTPQVDGRYEHWDHELIPHWSDKSRTRKRKHVPPHDIGANFYPELGPYSSADPDVVNAHMQQISETGVGVLAVSWYPPHYERTKETPVDALMPMLFDAAAKYGLKIAFHIEPYENRSGETLKKVVKYIFDKYGNHSAFYRTYHNGKAVPLFYIYDSYQIDHKLWAEALTERGAHSIRGGKYDALFLGLLVEQGHFDHLSHSGFDGFYTYFASNGFSYGSTWKNWPSISLEAKKRNLVFVPSIGPGYIDTRVRPWNNRNTKLRLQGRYYKSSFRAALDVRPQYLSVTSFNEWHEGTQIEAAVPKTYQDYKYEDYKPNTAQMYINLTKIFVQEYYKNMTQKINGASHGHDDSF